MEEKDDVAAARQAFGTVLTVCGAVDDWDATRVCILPPDHAEHTTSSNGVTWHKAVNNRGNGMGFATVVPGSVQPKLSDLGGLFQDYGDHVEPSGVPEKARYYVGYYCPRGNGHWELVGNDDYSTECRGKGWDLYLDDAVPDGDILPPGAWE